jgi:predicted type IV restriction endonuclease
VEQDYFDQLRRSTLSEGLTKLVIISPLLHLAGFYRAPYQVKLEEPVQVELTEQNETWRGRIDALVIQEQLWTVVVESKGSAFGIDQAIPQVLGYMFAAPQPSLPTYALVTNGSRRNTSEMLYTGVGCCRSLNKGHSCCRW